MKQPKGELTGAQHEIVTHLWESPKPLTVNDLHQLLLMNRDIARTTVLTWIQRLERRGWVRRQETSNGLAYRALANPEDSAAMLVSKTLDTHFEGSPTRLVMALVSHKRISRDEAKKIRKLLKELDT